MYVAMGVLSPCLECPLCLFQLASMCSVFVAELLFCLLWDDALGLLAYEFPFSFPSHYGQPWSLF